MTVGSATWASTPPVPESDTPTATSDPEHWQARLETFVGREREMQILRARIDDAMEGKGSLVLVSGEPGIGKTRLLTEAARYAEERETQVLWGQCWEGGGAPAFWPWLQVLRSTKHELKLADALFTSTAAHDRHPVSGVVHRHISDETQFQLFDTISTILRASAQSRPLVLFFDDLHHADPSSIRVFEFLLAEIRHTPYVIVATVRSFSNPPQPNRYLRKLENAHHTTTITLRGLGGTALRDFVTFQLPTHSISQADLRRIGQRTEGNPFFLIAACQVIRETGQIHLSAALDVPASVPMLLDTRLADLPKDCTDFLAAASVVGRTFSASLVAKVLNRHIELERISYLAESKGLITRSGKEAGEFQFSHAIFKEAFYSRLSLDDRLSLHSRIAQNLEHDIPTKHADAAVDSLAYHFRQARHYGAVGKALLYTLKAAAAAQSRAAHDHAVDLLSEALGLTDESDASRLEILLRLGDALCSAGRWKESRSTFLQSAKLATIHQLPSKFAEAAIGFKGLILSPAPPDHQSIQLLQEARSRLSKDERRIQIKLLHALATATHFSPPGANLSSLADDALRMASLEGDPSSVGIALEALIVANWRPGRARAVILYSKQLLEIGRHSQDDELVAKAHIHLYLARAQNLETDASRELDLAERWANTANHPKLRWQVSLLRSSLALARAQLAQGLMHAQLAAELGKRCHDETALLHLGLNLLLRARLSGSFDDSEDAIRAGAKLTPDIPLSKLATDCIDFAFDPRPRLRALNETLQACADYLHSNAFSLWAQCLLGELALLTGNREVSEQMAEHLEQYAEEAVVAGWGTAIEGATTHFLGLCYLSLGQHKRAVESLRAAVDTNSNCNWPLLRARSELFLALAMRLEGSSRLETDAARYALKAHRTYSQAGIDPSKNPFLSTDSCIAESRTTEYTPPRHAPIRTSDRSWLMVTDSGELALFVYGTDRVQLRKTKAIRQLIWLVQNPGREILASLLAQIDREPGNGALEHDSQLRVSRLRIPVIDDHARTDYVRRVREIRELLDLSSDDPADTLELREELDWLTDILGKSSSIGGKPRFVSDSDERARISVRNNLSNAIRRVRRQNSRMGTHLFNSIHTGAVCTYQPEGLP